MVKTLQKVKELTFACSRTLFHWLFSSPPSLLPPPPSLKLAPRGAFSRQLVPPRTLPLLILSIHIAPLRGGGGAAMGWVSAAIIAISSLSPGDALSPLPYIHPLIHQQHHQVSSFIPTLRLLFLHLSQRFRSLCCECVCGQFHCVLGARWFWLLCATNHFFKITEKVKRDCRRAPHFHCVCFGERQSGSCLLG